MASSCETGAHRHISRLCSNVSRLWKRERTEYSQGDVLTAYYPNLILTPTLVNHGLLSTAGHVGTLRCFHRVFLLGGLACGLLCMLILDSSSTSHISAIAKHTKSLPSELVEHCFRIEA